MTDLKIELGTFIVPCWSNIRIMLEDMGDDELCSDETFLALAKDMLSEYPHDEDHAYDRMEVLVKHYATEGGKG